MILRIMTLNLWAYFDWENREKNIKNTLKRDKPDIVAMQEVQINTHFSDVSQAEDLAKKLGYSYFSFTPTWGLTDFMEYDKYKDQRLAHGLGFISKYPIKSVESYFLKQQPDHDEPYGVQLFELEIEGKLQLFCNLHFGNSDRYSELHLHELMHLLRKRNITPILLGDFNNFNLEKYSKSLLSDYTISTEIAAYESMPKDNGTLDYILVPKNMKIKNIVCLDEYISDHRALRANITL